MNWTKRNVILATAIALLAVIFLFILAFSDEIETRRGVTVGEVVENIDQYVNRVVSVSGEVNDIITPRIFTIGGEEFFGGEELLVVAAETLPQIADRPAERVVLDDDIVLARGRVERFGVANIERQAGIELDQELLSVFEGRPVVIARDISITARLGADDQAVLDPITSTVVITDRVNRNDLIGISVELVGVEVQSVVGEQAFWIGEGKNQNVFVVLDENVLTGLPGDGAPEVNQGDSVSIIGEIRELPSLSEAREMWGLSGENTAQLSNQDVYIHATQFYQF